MKAQAQKTVKELKLIFSQNGTKVETNFIIDQETKQSLLVGTAVNELFTLQSNYRKAGLKLFKSSEPVLFSVSDGQNTLLDVGKCNRRIIEKLKFNKTSKSMSTFAKRVNLAVNELSRAVAVVDIADIEAAILSIVD